MIPPVNPAVNIAAPYPGPPADTGPITGPTGAPILDWVLWVVFGLGLVSFTYGAIVSYAALKANTVAAHPKPKPAPPTPAATATQRINELRAAYAPTTTTDHQWFTTYVATPLTPPGKAHP